MNVALKRALFIFFILLYPLFAQYNFDFTSTSDTVVVDTLEMLYYFRLENTGTLPDSYAIDCYWVSDSIPGWVEIFCAGGMCTWPGITIYEYLDVGEVDNLIDVQVYPTSDSGMEVLNLHVQSVFEPALKDSITVFAVYGVSGQYSFDFSILTDTIIADTGMVEFQFSIENTGTSSDTYAFDLRVTDSVPGWDESFYVGGAWADPGTILTEYLGVWAIDSSIYVRVNATGDGTEILNLLVSSTANPSLQDSITVYVIFHDPGVEEHMHGLDNTPLFMIYPTPFKNKTDIRYVLTPSSRARPGVTDNGHVALKIYDVTGRLVKEFLSSTPDATITWDGTDEFGRNLPRGVYVVGLVYQDVILTDKTILLR